VLTADSVVLLAVCLDIAETNVKAAMQEITAAGYDCFQTSLGGPGVTASIVDIMQ